MHKPYIAWGVRRFSVSAMPLLRLLFLCAFGLLLTACGGSSTNPNGTAQAVIGPAGGTLNGPDGLQIVIPAGALANPVTIQVRRSPATAPSLAAIGLASGAVYEITPHGLQFSQPVTIRFPAPSNQDPNNPQILVAEQGGNWVRTLASIRNGMIEVQRMSFSFFYWGMFSCSSTQTAVDPYACALQEIMRPTVTPISNTPFPNYAVSDTITGNTALSFDVPLLGAPDCANGQLQVSRTNTTVSGVVSKTVISQVAVTIPLSLTSTHVVVGSPTDPNYQITSANNGWAIFDFSYTCQRPIWTTPQTVSGTLAWQVAIADPAPQAAAIAVTDPADVTVTEGGGPATFSVNPIGTGPFTYQWKRNGVPISGEVAQSYTLAAPTVANDSGATFGVDVSSPWGATASSRDALLTVLSAGAVSAITVTVNSSPSPQQIIYDLAFPGSNRSYKALASGGNPPYTYQWTLNGQPLPASTTFGTTAGGCDVASVDYAEQGTRIFLDRFGTNCAGQAQPYVAVGAVVTDALGNTGTAFVTQPISPVISEAWQVRLVSHFDQFIDPAGIGDTTVNVDTVATDSAGNPIVVRATSGVAASLYRYSNTTIPAQVTGVVTDGGSITADGSIAADGSDNVVFNTSNNVLYRVGATGSPTLFAGVSNPVTALYPPMPLDGPATTVATFAAPAKMVANPTTGDVYVLEILNSASIGRLALVRKISGGQVTTIVNSSTNNLPQIGDIAFDTSSGNLYLLGNDGNNVSIYKLVGNTPTLVTTWVGSANMIAAGDGALYTFDGTKFYLVGNTGPSAIAAQGTHLRYEGPASSTTPANPVTGIGYDAVGHALIYTDAKAIYRLFAYP